MAPLGREEIERLVAAVPYWHHRMEFPHGVVSPGAYDPRGLFQLLDLPDLAGRRVLDIGTRDGFYAFECERRGALVTAVDHADPDLTGFMAARTILGMKTAYQQANVYDLDPADLGTFDVVLFLGVLYHLRHPLWALDRLRRLCTGLLVVESLVCDSALFVGYECARPLAEVAPGLVEVPMAQFLPVGRFHPDPTNKWVPNVAGLRALLAEAGFLPRAAHTWAERALVHAVPDDHSEASRWAALDRGRRTLQS
jgi:tRNA (mo5U34)-methyltransferase